ncbi:hypothetical protein LXA43DRAFT_1059928 [Ganoderma leucocontextum]|nr:hypothetical protein LXA43DRAFT_1059928 [Ganoderma leucocontextum]
MSHERLDGRLVDWGTSVRTEQFDGQEYEGAQISHFVCNLVSDFLRTRNCERQKRLREMSEEIWRDVTWGLEFRIYLLSTTGNCTFRQSYKLAWIRRLPEPGSCPDCTLALITQNDNLRANQMCTMQMRDRSLAQTLVATSSTQLLMGDNAARKQCVRFLARWGCSRWNSVSGWSCQNRWSGWETPGGMRLERTEARRYGRTLDDHKYQQIVEVHTQYFVNLNSEKELYLPQNLDFSKVPGALFELLHRI